MLRRLLIGPALMGATYAGGSYYGADAEQIVHKPPAEVYAVLDNALANAPRDGVMHLDGGRNVPYQVKLDSSDGDKIRVALLMNGRQGADTRVSIAPANGGDDTIIRLNIHADRQVLRQALAGTSKERLALAPDWVFNIAARSVLQQLAHQIETGQLVEDPVHGFMPGSDEPAGMSASERDALAQWHQYEATKPMVDPDEAARNYLRGSGG